MKHAAVVLAAALAWSINLPLPAQEKPGKPEVFARANLVAWCIVPFDAKKRGPEERAQMLKELGFERFAYDYRAEHVATFDAELDALKKQGIELTAWWFPGTLNDEARLILDVLKRHQLKPQLWITGGGEPTKTDDERRARILAEAARIRPIAEEAAKIGCTVALYNHGGWFGEPENQLAIIDELGLPGVGIVYNQHHGHDHLDRFAELLKKMLPKLVCLNLNGMTPDGERRGQKILPLGQGPLDLKLLQTIDASGYRGPIGILGHTQDDARERLLDNLDGLDWLVPQLRGKPAGERPKPRTPVPAAAPDKQTQKTKPLENHWGRAVIGFDWQESDSVDNRWNQSQIGPFLASIIPLPGSAAQQQTIAKGLSIRLGDRGQGAVCYDTQSFAWRAAWTGRFLKFDPARYGLINSPAIAGDLALVASGATWNAQRVQYRGLSLNDRRVVLSADIDGTLVHESPWLEEHAGLTIFTRTLWTAPAKQPLVSTIGRFAGVAQALTIDGVPLVCATEGERVVALVAVGAAKLSADSKQGQVELRMELPASHAQQQSKLWIWSGDKQQLPVLAAAVKSSGPLENLDELSRPGQPRWTHKIVTQGTRSAEVDQPYVVDTLTLPFENPYGALLFAGGHDFFANGDIALCTVHGDVWRVSGVDDPLQRLVWRRFATGLFQPLGLKIVGDQVHVLGRDQITRLIDHNADGEADEYQCFCNLYQTSPGGHDYVACLETESTGDFLLMHATQGLVRVARDGSSARSIATGFRNPNGMSVGPGDVITAAPQEGEWTPGSAIFEVRPGGHYGYGGPKAGHGAEGFDPPLAWLPRMMDNSSGGQVWATSDRWGPLGGKLLHLMYGKCRMALVLRERVGEGSQGAVIELPLQFRSGAMRGRFSPRDGQLYVSGLKGWASSAVDDGCLQRVRYTGERLAMPIDRQTYANGMAITFSSPLETESAQDAGSFRVQQWNYRYSAAYGSPELKISDSTAEGRDEVAVRSATLMADGRTVFLEIPALSPTMQTSVEYFLQADGRPLRQTLVATTNVVPRRRMDESLLHRPEPGLEELADESKLAPGVVVRFKRDAVPIVRTSRFAGWEATEKGSAVGLLKVPLRGDYRFHVVGQGSITLRINDRFVLDGHAPSAAVMLRQGYNRFQLEGESPAGTSAARLWWTDGTFASEPIPPTALFHDRREPGLADAQQRDRGHFLILERRCLACHESASFPSPAIAAGPDLETVGSRLAPSWIYRWLVDPAAIRPHSHMPRFFAPDRPEDRQAAADLSAYLATLKRGPAAPAPPSSSQPAAEGGELFESLGCIACHRLTPAAEHEPYDRVPLLHVAGKYQPGALAAYLQQPQQHYASTRMPDFQLTAAESSALTAHLIAHSQPPQADPAELAAANERRGAALFQKHRCQACHATELAPEPVRIEKTQIRGSSSGCLAEESDDRGAAPRQALEAEEARAIAAALQADNPLVHVTQPGDLLPLIMASLRCGACHNRDHDVAPLRRIVAEESESGLVPDSLPNLTWAGEKLRVDCMRQLFAGKLPYRSRPWLAARMPAFPAYADLLADGLAAEHGQVHTDAPPADLALAAHGDRLTRKDGGLDCRSCHAIGMDQPTGDDRTKVAPGINLLHTRERMLPAFYQRFVLDPPRHDITTRMPKLAPDGRRTAATGILEGDAPRQFEAIWQYLQTVKHP